MTVHVKGGDGGNGSAGIRREKYKPLAGPNGGNGGDGGSVIFMADSNANSLLDYRFMPHREAESGTMGLGDTKDGSKGADLILPVPVGTVVFEAKGPQGKPKHPGEQLADLRHAGDKFVVAAGGNGGLGNAALANRTRRAPGFALLGEPGEERDVILELKSIADVALVGFPSAGKSSLIAAMSSAKPKIADYPFTTLVPNLGVVVAGDMRYTIADVPGLIPGASQGKGLGLEFLRHIERTEIIAHVIDCATLKPGRDPMSDYQALEHELAEYAGKLELPLGAIPIPERPRIIILNKVDVPEAKELAEFVKPEFEKLGLKVHIISTASHEGLKELNWALADLVTNMRAEVAKREQAEEEARVVIKPLEEPRNRRRRNDEGGNALDFTVERKENGNGEVWYEVLGTKYVPVRVATSDLADFCSKYTVVENGGQLVGGYSEKNLTAYTLTAAVDKNTNGLKYATKSGDGYTFSAAHTGTGSGVAEAAQKAADGLTVNLRSGSDVGSFGEFIRVDLNGNYGELGSRMQSVVWTYYGNDSTYTHAKASYGTKFAADNWMHKSMGIQLGLSDSARCQLPEGTDGTGYWTITIRALGYADTVVKFQTTAENLAKHELASDADRAALQAVVTEAQSKAKAAYTADSYANLETELAESVELLSRETLYKAAALEQVTHLTDAVQNLKAA